jgi:hypothetical protein
LDAAVSLVVAFVDGRVGVKVRGGSTSTVSNVMKRFNCVGQLVIETHASTSSLSMTPLLATQTRHVTLLAEQISTVVPQISLATSLNGLTAN